MLPGDCAASEDGPLVRLDCIKLQSLVMSAVQLLTVLVKIPVSYLPDLIISHAATYIGLVGEDE